MNQAPTRFTNDADVMRFAVELARRGLGSVEPNPAVGAVLVDDSGTLLAAGSHERFGGPHAEVNAFADLAQRVPDEAERRRLLASARLFVSLEPCCHQGKTPPCSEAVIACGVRVVVVGMRDPFPRVNGGGIKQLQDAGIDVAVGILADEVALLTAPFVTLVTTALPYVHAKWAMTLDGKIATRTGESKWISNEQSRAIVHQLRGRMDAVIVGAGTARADDPLLTARPTGLRLATRIVVDSQAGLASDSQLVRTAREVPVIVACLDVAPIENVERLTAAGVEVLKLPAAISVVGRALLPVVTRDGQECPSYIAAARPDLTELLRELGRRSMTNVLLEGGAELLGSAFDQQLIDELHVFVAPKIVGGDAARSPIGGQGLNAMPALGQLAAVTVEQLGSDIYIRGAVRRGV